MDDNTRRPLTEADLLPLCVNEEESAQKIAEQVEVTTVRMKLAAIKRDRVFSQIQPDVRKIILSTNIAETSLTIPDVKHVIDTGKMKVMTYDSKKDSKQLSLITISQASAEQRAGRTGRTERGRCYRLYAKHTYENMQKHTMAEIKRASLVDSCLKIKETIGMESIGEFLSCTIEPPTRDDVTSAVSILTTIGALDSNENITRFGKFALKMPVTGRCTQRINFDQKST